MASELTVRRRTFRTALRRAAVLIQFVLLDLYVLRSSALCQQPSIRPYESEEDAWEALHDGEIEFDDFLELLDLFRNGSDSLTIPNSDWEALPGSDVGYLAPPDSLRIEAAGDPESALSRLDIPIIASVRSGVDADLSSPSGSDGYSIVRLRHAHWRVHLDWEHERENGGRWRRRSVSFTKSGYSAVAGSFEPRWGRGLVVGRRSRVIDGDGITDDVLYPSSGRFNGVWLSSPVNRSSRAQVFWTEIHGEGLIERAAAARIEATVRDHRFASTGLFGGHRFDLDHNVNDPSRSGVTEYSRILGFDYELDTRSRKVLAEFAIDADGASAKAVEAEIRLPAGRFHARAWSYGTGFESPWGGGPGHSDTRAVTLEELEFPFNSRTTGERGFEFTTRVAASGAVALRWDWMSHREEPGAGLEHSGVFRAEIKRPAFRSTPFVRAGIDEDQTKSYSVGNYLWWGPRDREFNLRCEFGTHYDDEVRFFRSGLGAKIQLNRAVRLAPAIRWHDPDLDRPMDGHWYFYFTETIVPIAGAKIEMALAWKHYESHSMNDLVELRVRGLVR